MNCRPDSLGRLSLDIQDWHPRTTDPFARSHRVGGFGRGNLEGKGKVQDLPWRRWPWENENRKKGKNSGSNFRAMAVEAHRSTNQGKNNNGSEEKSKDK